VRIFGFGSVSVNDLSSIDSPTFAVPRDPLTHDWRALQKRVEARMSFLDDRLGKTLFCFVGFFWSCRLLWRVGFINSVLKS
jgi:hypothetical protein